MCNDYAREIEISRVIKLIAVMDGIEPSWPGRRAPNDVEFKAHIRPADRGFVVRQERGKLIGDMMRWSWPGSGGKSVFYLKSENRNFLTSNRCLILATAFYAYTDPVASNVEPKHQHRFTLKGHEWFWIAGVIQLYNFAMLTTASGPDVAPYLGRQVCVLTPAAGIEWLKAPSAELLAAPAIDTFQLSTILRDGEVV